MSTHIILAWSGPNWIDCLLFLFFLLCRAKNHNKPLRMKWISCNWWYKWLMHSYIPQYDPITSFNHLLIFSIIFFVLCMNNNISTWASEKKLAKTKNIVMSNPIRPGTILGLIIKLIAEMRLTRMPQIK